MLDLGSIDKTLNSYMSICGKIILAVYKFS